MSRRGRSLGGDDETLWATFTKSIKPLGKPKRVAPVVSAPPPKPPPKPTPAKTRAAKTAAPAVAPPPKPAPPPLVSLDRVAKRRIARGQTGVEARLDLHGHTQAEAHDALHGFLHRAHGSGKRLVLVITGKSGVLRRQVPLWLALPGMRAVVLSVETAAVAHGGDGALYVRLRRVRE